MICTRCDGTGFLNLHQVTEETLERFDELGDVAIIQEWIKAHPLSDVQVCDCCGDGYDWHGEPGHHYSGGDVSGDDGPYAYNGGLPECS